MNWMLPIIDRYERPLLLYATSLCGNPETARDIVQDAFLRLARNGPPGEERLAPWLFTVCRNRSIDLHRKEERMTAQTPPDTASPDPSPDETLAQKDRAHRLDTLLAALPENQREVIRLRFQHDLSYREIGEITSLSISNVGFLIHTGIKKLRQLWPETLEVNTHEL